MRASRLTIVPTCVGCTRIVSAEFAQRIAANVRAAEMIAVVMSFAMFAVPVVSC